MDALTKLYLDENRDPHTRLCHCGCGEYVVQDPNNVTRYHFSEECAARCLARRGNVVAQAEPTDEPV